MTPCEWEQNLALLRPRGFLIYSQNWAAFARHYIRARSLATLRPIKIQALLSITADLLWWNCWTCGSARESSLSITLSLLFTGFALDVLNCIVWALFLVKSSLPPNHQKRCKWPAQEDTCSACPLPCCGLNFQAAEFQMENQSMNAGRWLNLTPLLHIKCLITYGYESRSLATKGWHLYLLRNLHFKIPPITLSPPSPPVKENWEGPCPYNVVNILFKSLSIPVYFIISKNKGLSESTPYNILVLSHVKDSSGVTHTGLEKESGFPAPRAPLAVFWAVPSNWTGASIASRINNSLALVALPCSRKRVTSWGHSGALSLLVFWVFLLWRPGMEIFKLHRLSLWPLLGQLF